MTQASTTTAAPTAQKQESVKETIISVIISFAMAFVFRSYVVEPFRIPTGSMAPTLLGAHMRFESPAGGYTWTTNYRDLGANQAPLRVQGDERLDRDPFILQDPMTGLQMERKNIPLLAGDRILVLKYLYLLREPARYDVVVFKNPVRPKENLIKRLVGLPGEDVLIVDGDIFVRPSGTDEPYQITRKPDRTQREVWAPLFSTEFAPPDGAIPGWRAPWTGDGWELATREYRWDGAGADGSGIGTLRWDAGVRKINDLSPYNSTFSSAHDARANAFPVSDLRVRARVKPDSSGSAITMAIATRGCIFEAHIFDGVDGSASISGSVYNEGTFLNENVLGVDLPAGEFTSLEFWHADQRLSLWVNGKKILETEYDWMPSERYARAAVPGREHVEPAEPDTYAAPEVSMSFTGSSVTLTGVALDRDLYYRAVRQNGRYFRASHPTYPAALASDEFFMLGDNSAASHDGRGWTRVDPWIGDRFGYKAGVVPRELILGKAFMVYWPAPYSASIPGGANLPVPNAGKVRFIR